MLEQDDKYEQIKMEDDNFILNLFAMLLVAFVSCLSALMVIEIIEWLAK